MKDFLKITKSKIILGLIIMVLSIVTAFYSAIATLCTENCPAPNIIQDLLSPTIQPFAVIMLLSEFFEDMAFLPEIVMIIFIFVLSGMSLLFFWYLISCLLIKLYSLIRKK